MSPRCKPREIEGANCCRFEQVLAKAPSAEQAEIIREALKRYPPDETVWKARTKELHDELLTVAD